MNLIDRYIMKEILAAIALVTLMLAGLQAFILFVSQLDSLGQGDYNLLAALYFVLLQIPYQIYLFFPIASLLGCLIGLGVMANHRELLILRAAGMSIGQVTLAVLKIAMILIVIVTLLGESIVPKWIRIANDEKTHALSGGQSIRTPRGVWLRHQDDFIAIAAILPDHSLQGVEQFKFDKAHNLELTRNIKHIDYVDHEWIATDIAETRLYQDHVQSKTYQRMVWDVDLNPTVLSFSAQEPDEMTLYQIKRYLKDKKNSHQSAVNYQIVYWQRLIQPLTTAVMMMLAIPFIFGPLRQSTMGSKLLIGTTVGFGFHIINRFFGSMSQVFQLSPEVSALAPTIIFALIGIFLVRKAK